MNQNPASPASYAPWLLLFFIAILCYTTGLDSLYLPSNGDEMVYSRIARLTSASTHWLPLVSDLSAMRNTKPPLLFWQAMVAGDWGQQWVLWRLRLPAVVYSLLTACGVAALTLWATPERPRERQRSTALIAACVYLAFFSSFRYGRPYLTSAAETFWLCLPVALVLWRACRDQRAPGLHPSALPPWPWFALFGLLWGVGLLYKSFALVLPAGAGLWCVLLALHGAPANRRSFWQGLTAGLHLSLRVALSGLVAVAVFALWFALDPDPGAVWREFVLGENAGKLATTTQSLSAKGIAITVQALAWVENAGPLAFVVLGLVVLGSTQAWKMAVRKDKEEGVREKDKAKVDGDSAARLQLALAAWALVWLIVFCLPSQRSARYVIPAMPALAMLVALNWNRLARGWFMASLLLCLPVLMLLARTAQTLWLQGVATPGQGQLALAIFIAGLGCVVAGLVRSRWTRACAVAMAFAVYGLLNSALAPLSGASGQFVFSGQGLPPHAHVAVPSTFNAQHERYQFLLPGAAALTVSPYRPTDRRAAEEAQLTDLLDHHDAVVWQQMRVFDAPSCAQNRPATCRSLATRWDLKSRHQPGEIRLQNLLYPEQWLLRREWVLTKP